MCQCNTGCALGHKIYNKKRSTSMGACGVYQFNRVCMWGHKTDNKKRLTSMGACGVCLCNRSCIWGYMTGNKKRLTSMGACVVCQCHTGCALGHKIYNKSCTGKGDNGMSECNKGCAKGPSKVYKGGKAMRADKGDILFLGKTADDIILDWITDGTTKSDKGKHYKEVHGGARTHVNLMGILTNYTAVLMAEMNMATCTLRRLYKDFDRPVGGTKSIQRSAFGSRYFSIQQWTGFWREWLQIHHVKERRTTDQGRGRFFKQILRGL